MTHADELGKAMKYATIDLYIEGKVYREPNLVRVTCVADTVTEWKQFLSRHPTIECIGITCVDKKEQYIVERYKVTYYCF